MPGPRKLALLERFALSKLALKMYSMPSLSQIAFTCDPIWMHWSRDSMTQGPAMMRRGFINRVSGFGDRVSGERQRQFKCLYPIPDTRTPTLDLHGTINGMRTGSNFTSSGV